ncbi:hypothetical protein DASC09_049110 [Saccharomycopsis crataegensis]|uniref:Serine/threonine-protein phosphatase 4 regulatory subunit 2 n=1 Tax=Saccharomycopsis crataegensis TaxID=43959 RepID=A0AAV5QS90_9ASCO|nr:hypothetical protein DASC09_049110 [Saccharomycopsis crataegensis]
MDEYSIDLAELTKSLDLIILQKTYNAASNNLAWPLLQRYMIRHIFKILTTDFSLPLTTMIYNPLMVIPTGNPDNGFSNTSHETIEGMATRICEHLEVQFPRSPPFTILRLAETLMDPTLYYKEDEPQKFLRSLEILVYVQSSVAEFPELKRPSATEKVLLEDDNNSNNNKNNKNNNGDGDDGGKTANSSDPMGKIEPIKMEPIPWITETHLKEIEEDQEREREEAQRELEAEDAVEVEGQEQSDQHHQPEKEEDQNNSHNNEADEDDDVKTPEDENQATMLGEGNDGDDIGEFSNDNDNLNTDNPDDVNNSSSKSVMVDAESNERETIETSLSEDNNQTLEESEVMDTSANGSLEDIDMVD